MVRDTFQQILEGNDVRQNLSKLRQEVKDSKERLALKYQIGAEYDIFRKLLQSEDAKTRKNVALLIGDLQLKALLDDLYQAYEAEQTLFVKSSYLTALAEFDYRSYLPALKKRLETLANEEVTEENRKHHSEEMRALTELVTMVEGVKTHKFTGYEKENQLVLLTNRNHIHVTLDAIDCKNKKSFNAGVMVQTNDLESILKLRTIQEFLFMVPGMKTCPADAVEAAKVVAESKFLAYLEERHQGKAPFYFRIELKTRMDLSKKSTFTKRMGAEIERRTGRKLINSPSNYEIELRLIENKEGAFNVLVKLYTVKDDRFFYRVEMTPSSMKPVNAALTCELVKEYLKEDAQILDPFCGVGTLLIERHKLVKANTMYGIDLSGDAIDKARINTDAAHQIIHYVNKDFFEFEHEYLFDEIITDMPMVTGRKSEDEIKELYDRFLARSAKLLKPDGILIMYSHNKEFVRSLCVKHNVRIEKEFEISMKEGTYVFVLNYRY